MVAGRAFAGDGDGPTGGAAARPFGGADPGGDGDLTAAAPATAPAAAPAAAVRPLGGADCGVDLRDW